MERVRGAAVERVRGAEDERARVRCDVAAGAGMGGRVRCECCTGHAAHAITCMMISLPAPSPARDSTRDAHPRVWTYMVVPPTDAPHHAALVHAYDLWRQM